MVPDQQLPLALHLPRLHSLVLGNRASWLALPGELRLNHLEDLDLQVPRLWHCNAAVMMSAYECTTWCKHGSVSALSVACSRQPKQQLYEQQVPAHQLSLYQQQADLVTST